MTLPDQSHINRVREALWQWPDGGASVFVGAGFSRNAKKVGPEVKGFPLWHEITQILCQKLYPESDGESLKRARAEASGTSGFLRLAQEFESAFGRVALHKLILECVPNDNYQPDELHKRLLKLPWQDVFTTNWDTLLEDTRPRLIDRVYSVVRTPEEIPCSAHPRIVKLHGSFPAHFPFIFTEEDYRTYPKDFAPFVNTVQQAMMESIFLLIGFSGDDPNFLHWSGWVRDNLGKHSPKIYLAGWLDLSPHRRRMLEDRNVVAIDLARHPKAMEWPEHLRHRYATEWLLHTLEYGRPYRMTDWPHPPNWEHAAIPDVLQPVDKITVNTPEKEPDFPSPTLEPSLLLEKVREVIRVWTVNRAVYPGWLFIPPKKQSIFRSINHWQTKIIQVLPNYTPLERLAALSELNWRREIALEPLTEELSEAIQLVLNEFDCQNRIISQIKSPSEDWVKIRENWRNLSLSLLTASRLNLNSEQFDYWLVALKPFLNDHPDIRERTLHEQCLYALYQLDYEGLMNLLDTWKITSSDPAWLVCKASVLIEVDENDEAVRLINNALSIVRAMPNDNSNFALISREGWLLNLVFPFCNPFVKSRSEFKNLSNPISRQGKLAEFDCDAQSQKRDILYELKGELEKKEAPIFDLGYRNDKTIQVISKSSIRSNSALWALRICETAGLPPRANNCMVAYDILELVSEQLKNTNPALSLRIALWIATSESNRSFNRVWSRTQIARLAIQEVNQLVLLISKAVNFVLPKVGYNQARNTFWSSKLRMLIESLSRLVLRLEPEEVETIFKQALQYYVMDVFLKEVWLHGALANLMKRCSEALTKGQKNDLTLELLSSRLVGLDGFEPISVRYPDSWQYFNIEEFGNQWPIRDPYSEEQWTGIIQLILRGLRHGGKARSAPHIAYYPWFFGASLMKMKVTE